MASQKKILEKCNSAGQSEPLPEVRSPFMNWTSPIKPSPPPPLPEIDDPGTGGRRLFRNDEEGNNSSKTTGTGVPPAPEIDNRDGNLCDNGEKCGEGSKPIPENVPGTNVIIVDDEEGVGNRLEKGNSSETGSGDEGAQNYKNVASDDGIGGRGKEMRGGALLGKRQLPWSITGQRDEAGFVMKKKGSGFLDDLLVASKLLKKEVNDDGSSGDFLETAKKLGVVFPRPKWWHPEQN